MNSFFFVFVFLSYLMFETFQVIYYVYFYILFVAVFGDIISKTQGKEVYIDVSMFLPCLKIHVVFLF